jgi:hypothetical protein
MRVFTLHKELEGIPCHKCLETVKKMEVVNGQFYCTRCSGSVELEKCPEVDSNVEQLESV